MMRYVDRSLPRLPVRGPGVPVDEDYGVLATTNWMPYSWSINNVVFAENVHTALAYWQAGRADEAFRLTKSALLASMYMGICPGNVGSMSYLDVYRRESQRNRATMTDTCTSSAARPAQSFFARHWPPASPN